MSPEARYTEVQEKLAKSIWGETYEMIARVSRESGLPPLSIAFSHPVKDFGDGKYFMRIKPMFLFPTSGDPGFVNALLFYKPDQDAEGDGELIEITAVFSAWENGNARILSMTSSPINPESIPPLNNLEIARAAKQVVKDDSVSPVVRQMLFKPQTTLKQ